MREYMNTTTYAGTSDSVKNKCKKLISDFNDLYVDILHLMANNGITPNMVSWGRFFPIMLLMLIFVISWAFGNTTGMKLSFWMSVPFWLMDFLDGALARHTNQSTVYGKHLDAILDKIAFHCSMGIFFLYMNFWGQFFFIALLALDLLSTFMKIVQKDQTKSGSLWFGKWKLGFQLGALSAIAYSVINSSQFLLWLGISCLIFASILAFLSVWERYAIDYNKKGPTELFSKHIFAAT